jgi:arginase
VSGWVLQGAPLDSAAAGDGEERAPEALRAAGLAALIGARDEGDVAAVLRPPERDRRSGIIAFGSLVQASEEIAAAVDRALSGDERPIVLGGDCSLMIGVAAGLRRVGREAGLCFIDGHADYYDGESSPTGESADMDLAILHGLGPEQLAAIQGPPPLIPPRLTALLGHRPAELDPDVAFERERVPAAVSQLDAPRIREIGPGRAARETIEHLRDADALWVHLDLDALDEGELPAVSYPLPRGLSWSELEQLLTALVSEGRPVGISVADFNPDLDPDGAYAKRIVELLASACSAG